MRHRSLAFASLLLGACGPTMPSTDGGMDATADAALEASIEASADATQAPVTALMDFGADLTQSAHFYDLPYPSDLRLSARGTPDLTGFPHAEGGGAILQGLLDLAQNRPGWPVLPVGYFRFTGALSRRALDTVLPAAADAPVLLVDIDPRSSERGRLIPVVAATPGTDDYLLPNTLAVGARPGFVLRAGRTYAFVVRRSVNDASGQPLQVPASMAALAAGQAPMGSRGEAARTLYAPLFETLRTLNIDASTVVAATVFTTGDVVAETAAMGDRVLANYDVTIDNLALAPGDSVATHPRYCQLVGTVNMPQFQQGTPPFNTDGSFLLDANGVPQRTSYPSLPNYGRVPVTVTLPRNSPMPASGFPLVVYFHGSGGVSNAVVDRGLWAPQSATHPCAETDTWNGVMGCNTLGQGPAYVLAARGLAAAGSAMPVNPERLPGASETAYLNLNNLRSFPYTFRQGVFEQRLYLRALSRLRIPATLVAQCAGVTLPAGATEARFDVSRLVSQGQSMGGMYTNLISATEPLVRAAIPTGAGGYWGYFILQTSLVPGAVTTLGLVLGSRVPLTFVHPALVMLETAWEPAEPYVYMPRIARRPLQGHPVRPIYEPAGQGDSYFPTVVYDGAALAYGHNQAGREVWPTMQQALQLDNLAGLASYPVSNNRRSEDGSMYTGVVVQYEGDGVYDPHAIYSQLDAVKYQYSCFAQSFVQSGTARVPDPTGHRPEDPCN